MISESVPARKLAEVLPQGEPACASAFGLVARSKASDGSDLSEFAEAGRLIPFAVRWRSSIDPGGKLPLDRADAVSRNEGLVSRVASNMDQADVS
ncbi:MAG: hypothetical protein KatS3mg024_2254 [Armatimonadota bacterium]|nr:MAG: hypothetical protein KatS3mg024_2254 [Armatimonadota bacterium]